MNSSSGGKGERTRVWLYPCSHKNRAPDPFWTPSVECFQSQYASARAGSARWFTTINLKDVYFYVAVVPWDEMFLCVAFREWLTNTARCFFLLLSGCQGFCQGTRVFSYLNDLKIIFGLVSRVGCVLHSAVDAAPQQVRKIRRAPLGPSNQVLYPGLEVTSATINATLRQSRCTTMTALTLYDISYDIF